MDMDEVSSQMTDNPRPTPHPLGGYALCRQMLAVRKHMQVGEKMLNELSLNIEVNFLFRLPTLFLLLNTYAKDIDVDIVSPSPRVSGGI